jgi:hypothetical protein
LQTPSEALHLGKRERQAAESLYHPAPRRQGRGRDVGKGLVLDAATNCLTETEDREGRLDQQDLLHRVVFVLAAITVRLCRRILGADDAAFGAVMGKRGTLVWQEVRPPPLGV